MKKHVLMLITSAFILTCGAIAANAQESSGTPKMQQPDHAQHHPTDQEGSGMTGQGGMMGRGMMGQGGMMGPGMMGQGGMMGCGMMGRGGPFAMRIIFALMDSDGDGTVSLSEFQAAHEKIFKAMDVNKDGVLSLEEMHAFLHGTSKAPPQ